MSVTLFPYQREGVEFLAARKAALLADDPGLGKSIQSIRACDAVSALYVLVICPASVVENWKREIAKYREGDWSAFVVSYDRAVGADKAKIMAGWWDVCIIDEGHYLKTPTTKRTKGIYGKNAARGDDAITSRCGIVWTLTGTPQPNSAAELFTHMRALAPDTVRSARTGMCWTHQQFMLRYCEQRHNGFAIQFFGAKNEADLHERLSRFMLRRRKEDVLKDLPPIRFAPLYLEASAKGLDAKEADEIRDVLANEGVEGLRRIAYDGGVSKLRRLTGMAKAKPASNWIKDWLENNPTDKKLVVFAHHKDVIEQLYNDHHLHAVQVHGGMKQRERQISVDRLQTDPDVRIFIGQITAAGVGLTLTKATELLFVESSWVPAENNQAAMRIHRIGQTEPCLVRFATVAGSIDEDIQRALARKMESIAAVIDGHTPQDLS